MRKSRSAYAVLLPSVAVALSAQTTTGELRGRVRLAGAAEPPPVVLTLQSPGTGAVRTSTAGERGEYGFRMVPAGSYSLTVEARGYATRRLRDVQILLGTVSVLDLELAKEGEGSVEVVAEAGGADPQRTQVSKVIDPVLLEGLPINRRSFEDLSLTVPGVLRSNTPLSGAVPNSGLSFRGMSPRQNRFLLDGLDNNDLGSGAVGCPVGQEAVKEFQVITGAPSAEYGRASGGVVNSILKGGGNEVSGAAFAFHRSGQWDPHGPEGVDHQDFRQDQFGATVGGPLVRDRLFYFVSAERYRKRDVKNVSIASDAMAIITSPPYGFQVQNGPQPFEETQTTGLVKLDYLPDDRNRWGLRVSTGQGSNENQVPWGDITARSAGATRSVRNGSLALSHQWLGGESWMNEGRFQFSTQKSALESMDPSGSVNVAIAGIANFGTNRLTPQDTRTEYFQFSDTATFFKGKHTLKAGIDLLHSRNKGTVEQNKAGVFMFQEIEAPGYRLSALDTFAMGLPVAYLQSWGNTTDRFSVDSDALFLQDDWQVTPRLLLKLGLRYDRESLPTFDQSVYARLHSPDPGRLADGAIPYSQLFATESDWSSSRLSPRLSFSWQPKDTTRIYGGYGVQSGSTQLGSLFGPRLYNDRDVRTCFLTLMDLLGMLGPLTWLTEPDHRYDEPPPWYLPTIVIPGSYRMPKTVTKNLGFEWSPAPEHRITVDLIHSRTHGLMNVRDVNAYVWDEGSGTYRRPDQRYSQVLRVDGTGESRYWGQTFAWQWKASDALVLDFSYTHSKAEDNYTDWTPDYPLQNPYAPDEEWGLSSEDQTHRVLLSGIYRFASRHPLLRDTSVALIAHYASGRPYSVLVGSDANHNGDGTSDRPAGVRRNSERGPDTKTVDMRLSRQFSVRRVKLEVLLEVFNMFNTVNVVKVQNVLNAPPPHAYGTTLEYGPMRECQLGVRAKF